MGTRSLIGVLHGDVCKFVHCHWDGYLEHNGKILQENYDSPKANHLVALGDLSSLGPNIGEKHDFDCPDNIKIGTPEYTAWNENKASMCTFYERDRDETGCEFKVRHTYAEVYYFAKNTWCEYIYIMEDGVWFVDEMNGKGLQVLADAIERAKIVA